MYGYLDLLGQSSSGSLKDRKQTAIHTVGASVIAGASIITNILVLYLPNTALVPDAANRPQNDVGEYLGLYLDVRGASASLSAGYNLSLDLISRTE